MSLWRQFANLRIKGYHHPYDAQSALDDVDASKLELDKIDVKGCLWSKLIEAVVERKLPLYEAAATVKKVLEGDNELI